MHVNGDELKATLSHYFHSVKFDWTKAADLRAGDVLVLVNGECVVVEWVEHEILESPVKVYNFEVEDFHTYFVGKNSVLVHDMCAPEIHYRLMDITKLSCVKSTIHIVQFLAMLRIIPKT